MTDSIYNSKITDDYQNIAHDIVNYVVELLYIYPQVWENSNSMLSCDSKSKKCKIRINYDSMDNIKLIIDKNLIPFSSISYQSSKKLKKAVQSFLTLKENEGIKKSRQTILENFKFLKDNNE